MAILRIVQVIFALIVLILAAYAGSVFGADYFEGYAMSFFTFAWTIIFFIYIFVTPIFFPELYLYWAHLALEFLTTIFWLVTFALLAQEVQAWDAAESAIDEVNSIDAQYGIHIKYFAHADAGIKASKAATAIGAIEWLLFVITLIAFGYYLHQHRVAHGATGFRFTSHAAQPADPEQGEKPAPAVQAAPVEMQNVPATVQHQQPVAPA